MRRQFEKLRNPHQNYKTLLILVFDKSVKPRKKDPAILAERQNLAKKGWDGKK